MRGDQLARQWQLMQRLAKSKVGVGLDELAEDLDCVRRTVYRDLDALMYAGFPVVSERRDNRVYYRFLDSFRLGDVPFTPDELLALAFSEDLLRVLEGTVFHESIQSALAKVRAGLGPELTAYLERLAETFRVMPDAPKHYSEFRDTIQILNDAVLTQRSVTMIYRTGSTGEVATRDLDPYRVWYQRGGLYVIGRDHRSGEIRTFAIDRIREIKATERRFDPDPHFDFDSNRASSFGIASEPPVRVRIRIDPSRRPDVEGRIFHESQEVEFLDDGGLELRMEVGGQVELRNWVMSFGSGAEVLEPEELRREVRAELEAAAARYAAD